MRYTLTIELGFFAVLLLFSAIALGSCSSSRNENGNSEIPYQTCVNADSLVYPCGIDSAVISEILVTIGRLAPPDERVTDIWGGTYQSKHLCQTNDIRLGCEILTVRTRNRSDSILPANGSSYTIRRADVGWVVVRSGPWSN